MFLDINGYLITAGAQKTYDFMIGCYETGSMNFDKLTAWLRENTELLQD